LKVQEVFRKACLKPKLYNADGGDEGSVYEHLSVFRKVGFAKQGLLPLIGKD